MKHNLIDNLELRKSWRINWLNCIYEFASLKLQKMSWIQGLSANWPNGEIWVSCFSECICKYFDDLSLNDGYNEHIKLGLVSEEEVQILTNFHILADNYSPPFDNDNDILNDKDWHKVVDEAKKSWIQLKKIITEPDELVLINSLETSYGIIEPA